MSIKSRERQLVRLKAAGLTKPVAARSNPKRRDWTPPALNITDVAVESATNNRKLGREEKADKRGRAGAHGNGYLTHEQRTEASVRRQATQQIAQMHNEGKLPLLSVKKDK